jgi:hypothetical protein
MAAYLLSTGSTFSIASGSFATLDTTVISGEVTIDNEFWNDAVWGNADKGKSETRGRYQAIGNVTAYHDDTAAAAIATDFAPASTVSVVSMTFVGSKIFACNAHIYNFRILGDRHSEEPVKVSFSFRSRGDFTTATL